MIETPILIVTTAAIMAMTCVFIVERRTRIAAWVDVAWALMVGLAAAFYAAVGDAPAWQRIVVAAMGLAWGLRLAGHLAARVRRHGEDGRYAHMRRAIGDSGAKWAAFFAFQAGLVVVFSLPAWVAAGNVAAAPAWLLVGLAIFVVALTGEAIADRQLARFTADPANRGKVCEVGLWRYSRHPNYFFEWLHWFAWVALAVGSPWWWLSLAGAFAMLVSLLWVTGIPFVEAQSLRSRGEAYRDYQRRVSMFVPWIPKA
jgi:steroid 5-alpha reductase family enzyme